MTAKIVTATFAGKTYQIPEAWLVGAVRTLGTHQAAIEQWAQQEEMAKRLDSLAGDEQECQYCDGTGRDIDGRNRKIDGNRADVWCLECGGSGKIESQDPVYQATMRGES